MALSAGHLPRVPSTAQPLLRQPQLLCSRRAAHTLRRINGDDEVAASDVCRFEKVLMLVVLKSRIPLKYV